MIFTGSLQMFSSIPFAFGKMPEGSVRGKHRLPPRQPGRESRSAGGTSVRLGTVSP